MSVSCHSDWEPHYKYTACRYGKVRGLRDVRSGVSGSCDFRGGQVSRKRACSSQFSVRVRAASTKRRPGGCAQQGRGVCLQSRSHKSHEPGEKRSHAGYHIGCSKRICRSGPDDEKAAASGEGRRISQGRKGRDSG